MVCFNKACHKINTMTMGWGSSSYYWGKPVFIVPVRHSRNTHEMLECTDSFTISVPYGDDMDEELLFCGTHSGRDNNKMLKGVWYLYRVLQWIVLL